MKRLYYRTVKNNQIRLLGRTLGNESLRNGELDGRRFCFIPYVGASLPDGLTALWGTEACSKALNHESEEVIRKLYNESNRITAPDGKFAWYFWKVL